MELQEELMTEKIPLICLIIVYGFIGIRFLRIWLFFWQQDTALSDRDKFSSLAIVVLMTIFWPIVVPLAYLELLEKKKRDLS